MYAIHLSAVDNAGNIKTTRRFVLFDDLSEVTFNYKGFTFVETASAQTNFTWVTKDTGNLLVRWTGRFMNQRHEHNMWLARVNPYPNIEASHDDYDGRRTVNEVPNVQGKIVLLNFYTQFFIIRNRAFRKGFFACEINTTLWSKIFIKST